MTAALLSGIILALAFPPVSWGFLGWVALVPLIFSIENAKSLSQALTRGFLAGGLFFLFSLHWIVHVAFIAWPLLVLLESTFFVLFSWMLYEGKGIQNSLLKLSWIPLAWMTAEITRAEIPVFSFGWNLLGFSQARYLPVIQSADLFGAYGLGFFMAASNAVIYVIMRPQAEGSASSSRMRFFSFATFRVRTAQMAALGGCLVILSGLFTYGNWRLSRPDQTEGKIRISVIQGNIPQSVKWETLAREKILEIYTTLTELAAFDGPSLVIWPEAAFPGYFNRDIEAPRIQDLVKKTGIPLLFGAPHLVTDETAFNSAYLMDSDGSIRERYDKQNLVPFGEYVPLRFLFGFLERVAYALGVSDFSAGKMPTVFRLFNGEINFSVLICFEDTFPGLARRFVDSGARFLVVMTNDAWFGNSSAPYQHLDASIFRAVENGVPVVRAANTGVSAFISRRGRVFARVRDKKGKDILSMGKETAELEWGARKTFFRRGGWIFPYAGAGLFSIIFLGLKLKVKSKR